MLRSCETERPRERDSERLSLLERSCERERSWLTLRSWLSERSCDTLRPFEMLLTRLSDTERLMDCDALAVGPTASFRSRLEMIALPYLAG